MSAVPLLHVSNTPPPPLPPPPAPPTAQWQQPNLPKPKKVRPSTSRYAALTERGLDVKAAFFPDCSPLPPGGLVESDDL